MIQTVYKDFCEINKLQTDIMVFIQKWARAKKTPIPQKKIIDYMEENGIKDFTAVNALNELLFKRYIRKAYVVSNKTYYVQLRSV